MGTFTVNPLGIRHLRATESMPVFTWATKPTASQFGVGQAIMSDVGVNGSLWRSDGSKWYRVDSQLAPPGNIGTRIIGGRMENAIDNTAGYTWELCLSTAEEFDYVRVILAQGNVGVTPATPNCQGTVRPVADFTDAIIDAASTVGITTNSTGSFAIPASTVSNRRGYLATDWIVCQSVPRTDGLRGGMCCIRLWVNGGNPINLLGASSNADVLSAASRVNPWRVRRHPTGGNQTASASSGFSLSNSCPIVGIQYAARGKVYNVMGFGDSIFEGRGTNIGEGFGVIACEQVTTDCNSIAVEYSNLGWSGKSTSAFRDALLDITTAGIYPDIALIDGGSPNDGTPSASTTKTAITRIMRAASVCAQYKIHPILATQIPTNTAIYNWGSADLHRVTLNQTYLGMAAKGFDIVDFGTVLKGITSNSQEQILAGMTTDNIHPNDAGNLLLKSELANCLKKIIGVDV